MAFIVRTMVYLQPDNNIDHIRQWIKDNMDMEEGCLFYLEKLGDGQMAISFMSDGDAYWFSENYEE